MNYLVSDIVIRLKNAVLARRRTVVLPQGKMSKAISKVLIAHRFLTDAKEEVRDGRKVLVVTINYQKRTPLFTDVRVISKPSLRVYVGLTDSRLQGKGIGLPIVSTSKGVMSGKEAFKKGLGGELLFEIW